MGNLRKVFLMLLIAVMAAVQIPQGVQAAGAEEEELSAGEAASYEVPATGKHGFRTIGGKRYYYKKNGKLALGWTKIYNNLYYMGKNGVIRTGWKKIGGQDCYFNFRGRLVYKGTRTAAKEEQLKFIEMIANGVKKHGDKYRIYCYSAVIGQAILESGWGKSTLASKYNNFFGLKCGTLWTGKSVNMLTGEEYTPGTYTTISANFRAYDNMEEGVKGYFEFLFRNRTRYNNLIGETNPYRYLEKIKEDGYATSSRYVQNTYAVLVSENLTRFDK